MWHDCGPRVLGIYFEPVRAEKIKQIAMSKDKETKKSEQEEVKEQPADAAGNGPQEARAPVSRWQKRRLKRIPLL